MKAAEFNVLKKKLDSEILNLTEDCLDMRVNEEEPIDETKLYKLKRLEALSAAASYIITLDPDL
jgi:hypothetical protein